MNTLRSMVQRARTPRGRRALVVTAGVLVLVFGVYRALRLDVFPALTSDSMSYMDRSLQYRSPGRIAHSRTVVMGHKYAGYPIFIAMCRGVGALVGSDPLTTIVVVQRLLFVAAIAMSVRLLGLFAAPLVYMLSAPSVVCFSNFVLTEGVTIPCAVLYACSLLLIERSGDGPAGRRRVAATVLLSSCAAVSLLFMVMCKLPNAVFALPWVVVVVRARVRAGAGGGAPAQRTVWPAVAMSMTGVVLLAFVLHASMINKREFGRFFPTVNTGRILYWGAHYSVFTLRPANRQRADLQVELADGSSYPRLYEVARQHTGLDASETLRDEARALLRKAGISYPLEALRSAGFAMIGGERQELKAWLGGLLEHDGSDGYMGRPPKLQQMGERAWLETYNDGRTPGGVPGLARGPMAPGHEFGAQRWLSVVLLAAVAALVAVRREGFTALAMCISVALFCAVVGHMLVDIWRYLLNAWMVLAVAGCWAGRELAVRQFDVRVTSDGAQE
ncbi:MAG: hypothetical protein IID28_07570 [Planctomycetes bacterium]|nr:hypothetical protein [Planctomycetota bacterium]